MLPQPTIDGGARFSFRLSIVVITLSFLSLNLLAGIRVTEFKSSLITVGLNIIPVVLCYHKRLIR